MIDTEHFTVAIGQDLRPGHHRYRLECGQYFECGCVHAIGSHAICPKHLLSERVTTTAISRFNEAEKKWIVTVNIEGD